MCKVEYLGSFRVKKLSDFTPFLDDPVRFGNRTYRGRGSKTRKKTEN